MRRRAYNFWDRFLNDEDGLKYKLFYNTNLSKDDEKNLFSRYVEVINLETSTYCNRACNYCPLSRSKRGDSVEYIDDLLFDKIIDELKDIEYSGTITLNLYNEPLASDDIFSRIYKIKQSLPKSYINMNSNGDFLTKEKLDRLIKVGLDAIYITLHTNYKYSDDNSAEEIYNFLMMLGIEGTIDTFIPNVSMSSSIDIDSKLELKVMTNNWSRYGNYRAGSAKVDIGKSRNSPCMKPIREFTISYSGEIYPCCNFFPDSKISKKYHIGDLFDQTIFQLYNSNILKYFRSNLLTYSDKFSPCDLCSDPDNSHIDTKDRREMILHKSIR